MTLLTIIASRLRIELILVWILMTFHTISLLLMTEYIFPCRVRRLHRKHSLCRCMTFYTLLPNLLMRIDKVKLCFVMIVFEYIGEFGRVMTFDASLLKILWLKLFLMRSLVTILAELRFITGESINLLTILKMTSSTF